MGQLDLITDPTGSMSDLDVVNENLTNIVNEMNRTDTQNSIGRKVNGTDYYYDSNGVNYMQIGEQSDGSQGVRIAQQGIDLGTATNNQLVFNSSQNIFKIANKIMTNIPSFVISSGTPSGGFTSLTVAHGLTITPIVQAYVQGQLLNTSNVLIATSYIPLPLYIPESQGGSYVNNSYYFPGGSGSYQMSIAFGVDATNVYIEAICQTSAADTITSIPLTIFCLQESAT